MYLMKTKDGQYTLKKVGPEGIPTKSAHPCRFSPDDKFSKHRVIIKKRFGMFAQLAFSFSTVLDPSKFVAAF